MYRQTPRGCRHLIFHILFWGQSENTYFHSLLWRRPSQRVSISLGFFGVASVLLQAEGYCVRHYSNETGWVLVDYMAGGKRCLCKNINFLITTAVGPTGKFLSVGHNVGSLSDGWPAMRNLFLGKESFFFRDVANVRHTEKNVINLFKGIGEKVHHFLLINCVFFSLLETESREFFQNV